MKFSLAVNHLKNLRVLALEKAEQCNQKLVCYLLSLQEVAHKCHIILAILFCTFSQLVHHAGIP